MDNNEITPSKAQTNEATYADIHQLSESIDRFISELSGKIPRTARIDVPNSSDLVVRLVNANMLQRLDELRDDISIFQGLFWTPLGSLLGSIASIMISNLSFSNLNAGTYVFLTSLIVACIVFGALLNRSTKRANKIKEKILFKPAENSS